MMSYRIFAAAVAASLLATTPALADEDGAGGVSVEYSDLDLTSAKGQAALERRVLAAVNQVCEANSPSTGSRIVPADKRRCIAAARKSAKAQGAAILEAVRRGGCSSRFPMNTSDRRQRPVPVTGPGWQGRVR